MRFDIQIDNLIITADVHSFTRCVGVHWDCYGFGDLEYTIERVLELDEDNLPFDLTIKESDAILCRLDDVVKTKLIEAIEKQIEDKKENDL